MTIRLDGKVAIVTGAGAGLGLCHAKLLASLGAKVVVNDPGEGGAAADRVVAEIKAAGGEAVANHASVADRAGAASIVQTAIDTWGAIHIVLNNAGILRDKTFAKMDLDDYELVLKVHLLGSVYVVKAALPYLMEQKYGRIVMTTSAGGLANGYGQTNYGSAKAAMLGFANNLKNEVSKLNIKINLLSPVASTAMTQGVMDEKILAILKPELVSPAAAWMCSEECDVSGEVIAAGGGYFARVKVVKTEGAVPVLGRAPTVDEFHAAREAIFDMSKAKPYSSTIDEPAKRMLGLL